MNGPGAGRRADVGDVQRERAPRPLGGPWRIDRASGRHGGSRTGPDGYSGPGAWRVGGGLVVVGSLSKPARSLIPGPVTTESTTSPRPVVAKPSKAQRKGATLPLFSPQGMGAGRLAGSIPGPVGWWVTWRGRPGDNRAGGEGAPGYRPPGKTP